jgi:hypothetical protein
LQLTTAAIGGCLDGDFAHSALEVIVDDEAVGGSGAEVLQRLAHGLPMVEVLQKLSAG